MHISDILAKGPTCSFEFFPPKTEKGAETLYETIQQLENLRPSFVSVTSEGMEFLNLLMALHKRST